MYRETPVENIIRWAVEEELEERLSHGFKIKNGNYGPTIVVTGPSTDVVWDGYSVIIDQTVKVLSIYVGDSGAWIRGNEAIGFTKAIHYALENPEFPDNLLNDAEYIMDQQYAMVESRKEELRMTNGEGF
jgi:hypothetical protein